MESLPKVTVVLPIRNEAGFISRSLGAVLRQDYPAELLEVIVADGMSDDGTREIIRSMQDEWPNLRLINNPGRIVATGLNLAVKCATGDVIVRVDGHTIIAPDYVSQCVETLTRTRADNVGGRMNATSERTFGKAVALATSSPFGVGGARFHYSNREEWVDTVYMGAWPRKVFEKIGLFDVELVRNQDDELNYRLLSSGGKILLNPNIRSQYFNRSSLKSLWSQYYQYGYWKVRVMQKHLLQMRVRQFIPPLFAATLLVAMVSAIFSTWGRVALISILALYLLTSLVASFYIVRKGQLRLLPLLPVVFATLHLSYGFGFLVGLVRFINRWNLSRGDLDDMQIKGAKQT